MLKPLKVKKDKVSPPEKVEAKKPAEIIVSLVNGQQVYSNAETGQIVKMDNLSHVPSYEIFNPEKASIIISSLAQGNLLKDSLEHASVSKATFSTWLMKNEEFSQALDKARSVRAQHTHEKFYATAHEELTKEIPEDDEDIKKHMQKLAVISRRQKILNIQKKEDSPNRFSDKESNQTMAASVSIAVDPEIISKMQTRFKASVDSEGAIDTQPAHDKLNDILEADFKDVTNE